MTNANRATRKGGKKVSPSQSANTPENTPEKPQSQVPQGTKTPLINPSYAAIDLVDALALMRATVDDAGSLVLMCVMNIEWHRESFAGWEPFDGHEKFDEGLYGLCRMASATLRDELDRCERRYAPMVSRLRAETSEVHSVNVDMQAWEALLRHYEYDSSVGLTILLDESVSVMQDLLEMLGVLLSDNEFIRKTARNGRGYFIAQAMQSKLKTANERLLSAENALKDAAVAVEIAGVSKQKKAD
jgi:hypothetical protein